MGIENNKIPKQFVAYKPRREEMLEELPNRCHETVTEHMA
jgi:hypothetical protein